MSDIQSDLKSFNIKRNSLHPASESAKKISIQIFEYQARLNELTYLLNISNEN